MKKKKGQDKEEVLKETKEKMAKKMAEIFELDETEVLKS